MSDLRVEKQALLSDAKAWHQAAEELSAPATSIEPLTLNGADDVMGMGSRMGIDANYEEARTRILELIAQATDYFDRLAGALVDVGQTYENNDQDYADRLSRLEAEIDNE
ncbi:hypothetical protein [Amycolatopsis aidingensis]|uniref:hypothetical protein n=1 Tax=Amycolatopsis aidingensis TaxID=2842453 RepID=UPI001C0B37BE|nr:hypothetical protein [Amycolatopsis aidingensis]